MSRLRIRWVTLVNGLLASNLFTLPLRVAWVVDRRLLLVVLGSAVEAPVELLLVLTLVGAHVMQATLQKPCMALDSKKVCKLIGTLM